MENALSGVCFVYLVGSAVNICFVGYASIVVGMVAILI